MRHVLSRATRLEQERVEATYEQIEGRFADCVTQGSLRTDPYLTEALTPQKQAPQKQDTRRGLTLFARPSEETVNRVYQQLTPLKSIIGDQYIQPGHDLHTTVLSVIPGIANYNPNSHIVPVCVDAVNSAIEKAGQAFAIEYRGIIGASDSLLVTGYPTSSGLQALRTTLLAELEARGVEENFNRRYVMVAAHMSVVRFIRQPNDLPALQQTLDTLRDEPFGVCAIDQLELAENDWYMRRDTLLPTATYALRR